MVTYDDWGNEKPSWSCLRVFRVAFWSVLLLGGVGGAAYGIYIATHKKGHGGGSNPSYGPVPITTNNYTFSNALSLTLQFLNGQKSGKLPAPFPIKWRGDSCLTDGSDVGLDLTGGLYDAGDHIKFGLPMAYTATILAWGVLEYGPQMQAQNQLSEAVDRIKWITDYIIKAHPSPNVYYFQVGDPNIDHKCWQRAEDVNHTRPSSQVNATSPGSDVAGEAAAALAAASIVFKRSSSYMNTTYAALLLSHSTQLFTFADTYQGLYSESFPEVEDFYNSTGFEDELLWAASWLYQATGENTYINYVTGTQGQLYGAFDKAPLWLSWDDKRAGVQVLLSRTKLLSAPSGNLGATALSSYQSTADKLMCALLPNSPSATLDRSKGGMIWVTAWDASIETVNAAFLALVYSDYLLAAKSELTCSGYTYASAQVRHFAFTQVDYLLGNNPAKRSYLVGYGNTYSQFLHHRGASIPEDGNVYDCGTGFEWLYSTAANPNIAYGGLVGGPAENDTFTDDRSNTQQNEAATYNSATLAGLLAGLSYLNPGGVPVTL
ncbi:unnamed protein product [Calypogeia fissa]